MWGECVMAFLSTEGRVEVCSALMVCVHSHRVECVRDSSGVPGTCCLLLKLIQCPGEENTLSQLQCVKTQVSSELSSKVCHGLEDVALVHVCLVWVVTYWCFSVYRTCPLNA